MDPQRRNASTEESRPRPDRDDVKRRTLAKRLLSAATVVGTVLSAALLKRRIRR